MSWFVIIVVVFAALSPLITMMPSRRQKQLAGLREAAAVAGMKVQLRSDPAATEEAKTAFYSRKRTAQQRRLAGFVQARPGENGWVVVSGKLSDAALAALASAPEGVSGFVQEPHAAGVFWDERGGKEEVLLIDGVLRKGAGRGANWLKSFGGQSVDFCFFA